MAKISKIILNIPKAPIADPIIDLKMIGVCISHKNFACSAETLIYILYLGVL